MAHRLSITPVPEIDQRPSAKHRRNYDLSRGAAFRPLHRAQFPGPWFAATSTRLCHAEAT